MGSVQVKLAYDFCSTRSLTAQPPSASSVRLSFFERPVVCRRRLQAVTLSHGHGSFATVNPNTNAWNRLRYGFYAPFYDLVARRLDRGRRRSIAALALQPGEHILIPGCGTGLDFGYLPLGIHIIAGDLSRAMVRKARKRADALGVDPDIQLMDAHALDLPDDHFDAALLHLILAVVPDPEAAIREVARVLKPGGRVGVFDKFLPDKAEPSILRRAAGAVTNVLATDLNRRLGPLLDTSGLELVHEAPIFLGGLFKVFLLRKPAAP